MGISQRSRWPAWLLGFAALTLGLAGTALAGTALAGSPLAQSRVTGPTVDRRVAAVWGGNANSSPAQVPGLSPVAQVAAGGLHSLVLRSDGTVWAWGNNWLGQLGDGTSTASSTPVQVPGLTGVIQVSANALHSLALRSDGTVWQWGSDGITDQLTPVEVPGLTGVTKISAGGQFSLALRSDGTVWAWGRNQLGQLGDGATTDSEIPVQVTGLSHVTSISAGFDASLATRTRGTTAITSVWAWGGNAAGQLGDGTLTGHLTPEQVTGINTSFISGISAGYQFAVALGTDGSVWGWGADGSGQLDNAPTSNPVTRPLELTGMNSGITQVSAGYDHVLALESNGTVLAWGDNSAGELGDGSTASAVGAVRVAGLTTASQVSAGGRFSLAIFAPPWIILAPAPRAGSAR
jgi:alpha-tubulin suppressor-like RCC1 family protein